MSDNTCSICLEPLLGGTPEAIASTTTNDNCEADQSAIGAAIPCGHCFHVNCFAMWKASRNRGQICNCPNCNKPAKDCVRIFIAPPDNLKSQSLLSDDEDDLSLHSTDSRSLQDDDDQESDEKHDTASASASTQQESSDNSDDDDENAPLHPAARTTYSSGMLGELTNLLSNDDDNDDGDGSDMEILNLSTSMASNNSNHNSRPLQEDFVDLTASPGRPSSTTSTCSSSRLPPSTQTSTFTKTTASATTTTCTKKPSARSSTRTTTKTSNQEENPDKQVKRFKVIAKKYKRRFQQKDSQFREHYKQHQTMALSFGELKGEVSSLKDEVLRLETNEENHARVLGAKNLELVQLGRNASQLQSTVETLTTHCQRSAQELKTLRQSYQKDLESARSTSMVEVQQVLDEHPKLIRENQDLKRKVAHFVSQLQRQRASHKAAAANDAGMNAASRAPSSQGLKRAPPSSSSEQAGLAGLTSQQSLPSKKRKGISLAKDLRMMDRARLGTDPIPTLEEASHQRKGPLDKIESRKSSSSSSTLKSLKPLATATNYSTFAQRMAASSQKVNQRHLQKQAMKKSAPRAAGGENGVKTGSSSSSSSSRQRSTSSFDQLTRRTSSSSRSSNFQSLSRETSPTDTIAGSPSLALQRLSSGTAKKKKRLNPGLSSGFFGLR